MKKLFICERPYPLYRTLLKAAANTVDEMDIVIAEHTPDMGKMVEPLRESGLFRNVFFFDDELYREFDAVKVPDIFFKTKGVLRMIREKHIPMLKKLFAYFRIQRSARRIILPRGLDFSQYDEIYVNDATSSLNLYLFHNRNRVIWVEHAKDALALREFEMFASILRYLELFRLAFGLRGCCRFVTAVEVSRNENLLRAIRSKEVREVPLQKLVDDLSREQKDCVYQLYRNGYGLPDVQGKTMDILLTTPLYADKFVQTLDDQRLVYQNIISTYMQGADMIFIKPHPRDRMKYDGIISNCFLVPRCISAEIFALSSELTIRNAVTTFSSTLESFTNAQNKVEIGKENILKFLL